MMRLLHGRGILVVVSLFVAFDLLNFRCFGHPSCDQGI
jgi:hypothetical protein